MYLLWDAVNQVKVGRDNPSDHICSALDDPVFVPLAPITLVDLMSLCLSIALVSCMLWGVSVSFSLGYPRGAKLVYLLLHVCHGKPRLPCA